jgi:hypothetical protein
VAGTAAAQTGGLGGLGATLAAAGAAFAAGQAPAATTTPPATEPTTPEEAKLLTAVRGMRPRPDPAWLAQVQARLGLGAEHQTGAMNTPTLRALLAFRAERGLTGDRVLDPPTLEELERVVPGPALLPDSGAGRGKQAPAEGADTPKDQTAQRLGFASYTAYKATWRTASFLHGKVRGHPVLTDRVAAADKFLKNKFPGKDDETIAAEIGWNGSIKGSREEGLNDPATHVHAMGVALDVAPSTNPWIFPTSILPGRETGVVRVMKNAQAIFGGPDAFSSKDATQMGAQQSTDEIYERMAGSNDAVRRYLALGSLSGAALDGGLADAGVPEGERAAAKDNLKADVGFWKSQKGWGKTDGFMDMSRDVVRAMREAGGLAWGATDWGGEPGDMMHFDARTDAFGKAVYDAGRAVKKSNKAK